MVHLCFLHKKYNLEIYIIGLYIETMQKKKHFTSSLFALYIYMFHQKVASEITTYNWPYKSSQITKHRMYFRPTQQPLMKKDCEIRVKPIIAQEKPMS